MTLRNLRYSTQQIEPEDELAVLDALESPYLTDGPRVKEFEEALAAFVGAKYAVAVSSGTAALHVAMIACGVKKNDVVGTSPFSFVATANAALYCGADVEFEDVDPNTGNADIPDVGYDWVVPVHFGGHAAPISARGEYVIEDAAHALGATDFDGCSQVGSCAHSMATCFSFHPVKPITSGEGGAITTNDEGLAQEMKQLRSHGRDEQGLMQSLGFNYRMTEVAAALGRSQLRRCDEMRLQRKALAKLYWEQLRDFKTSRGKTQTLPGSREKAHGSAWHLYPVRVKQGRRDEVRFKLNAQGIGAQVHYSPLIPFQPYYRRLPEYGVRSWPNAEAWADEELSLPLHAGMIPEDVERVVKALREALA